MYSLSLTCFVLMTFYSELCYYCSKTFDLIILFKCATTGLTRKQHLVVHVHHWHPYHPSTTWRGSTVLQVIRDEKHFLKTLSQSPTCNAQHTILKEFTKTCSKNQSIVAFIIINFFFYYTSLPQVGSVGCM